MERFVSRHRHAATRTKATDDSNAANAADASRTDAEPNCLLSTTTLRTSV